jgi:N-acetylmuramoyl-L-alanine amidase
MPGALVEPLFLTNPDDVELLRRADVLDMLARSIAEGVLDYLGRP